MKKTAVRPDVLADKEKCKLFIENFVDDDGKHKYMDLLQSIADHETTRLPIDLDDVQNHEDSQFVERIISNTRRYISLFSDAADALMPQPSRTLGPGNVYDVWLLQRQQRIRQVAQQNNTNPEDIKDLPKELTRRYEMHILPRSSDKYMKMRDIKSSNVGHLVTVQGIVTRCSDVEPCVQVATYMCQVCGYESYQPVTNKVYNPLLACPSAECLANGSKGDLMHSSRSSKFLPFQEVKLQELPSEVPVGHVPRSITLRILGSLTRSTVPGKFVTVSGIFLPAPFTGFRAIRAGLTTSTFIDVTNISNTKKSFEEMQLTEDVVEDIKQHSENPDILDHLASSIAPEIFGMGDVKKALILLMVGGVTRRLTDGMTIRGDINVLLSGDPGVAKSQLLKYIVNVAPRAIYTTGKGSSGVGLTAAVTRDPISGDMTLEGGALVLADLGICCIDEFDKMEEGDRTAIHEVMEQQTVSIAKAGITTTLNARTCILAAANPVFGRWNPKISVEKNLGLPAALLSRFDLVFKLLDRPNEQFDLSLAQHVTHVHMHSKPPDLDTEPLQPKFLRAYVAYCRRLTPYVPEELHNYIVSNYVTMREEESDNSDRQRFCTARSLLSILRLSQACARVHLRNEVAQSDVEEAMRLLNSSKYLGGEEDERKVRTDPVSAVFTIIQDFYLNAGRPETIRVADVRSVILRRGLKEEDLNKALADYEDMAVWTLTRDRTQIRFVNMD